MKKPSAKKPVATKPAVLPDEARFEAQAALHTLKRAHEIRQNPKLMHHVREHAKHEKAALSKVIGRKS